MSTNQRSRPDSALIYVINMEFLDHNQETIKGQRGHPPYTPYSIGNSSRVIFNTTDLKGD